MNLLLTRSQVKCGRIVMICSVLAAVMLFMGCSIQTTSQLPEKITAEVANISPSLQGYELDVTAHSRGEVELVGFVSSTADKARVMAAVAKVPGVVTVSDKLEIRGRAMGDRPQGSHLADPILHRLESELVGAQYLLSVEDAQGDVVLRGQVDSEATKQRVVELASKEIPDSVRIIDQLQLIQAPTDTWILQQVKAEVEKRFPQWRDQVTVTQVNRGVVGLSGSLRDHWEIDSLLATVVMVPGVKDIASGITINGQPYHSDGLRTGRES